MFGGPTRTGFSPVNNWYRLLRESSICRPRVTQYTTLSQSVRTCPDQIIHRSMCSIAKYQIPGVKVNLSNSTKLELFVGDPYKTHIPPNFYFNDKFTQFLKFSEHLQRQMAPLSIVEAAGNLKFCWSTQKNMKKISHKCLNQRRYRGIFAPFKFHLKFV